MKFLPFIFLAILVSVFCVAVPEETKSVETEYEYLRIHIRANSNSNADQKIKFDIKNDIVNFLTPYLSEAETKEDAIKIIQSNLKVLEVLVDNNLEQNNFDYKSSCEIKKENFPTRYYDNYVLEEGEYDALIITLGEGEGDNWWCVVYPPLCFVNKNVTEEQDIVYNSRLLGIIKKFFE